MYRPKEGDKVNILMKPIAMLDWVIIRETTKCYVIRKTFKTRYGKKNFVGDCYYLPKKQIMEIEIVPKKK